MKRRTFLRALGLAPIAVSSSVLLVEAELRAAELEPEKQARKDFPDGVFAEVADSLATDVGFATTIVSEVSGQYTSRTLIFLSGEISGQSTCIEAFDNWTQFVWVARLPSAPKTGDKFVII